MLVADTRFQMDEMPGFIFYADHENASRFYGVPAAPRIAVDEQGKPLINCVIFGKRRGDQLQAIGANVTLTTQLSLTEPERAAARVLLAKRMADSPEEGKPLQALPEVELLSPEWWSGEVTARLAADLEVRFKPSLMATNECVFSVTLTAAQAGDFKKAWENGLPDAWITYRMQAQAVEISRLNAEEAASSAARTPTVTNTRQVSASFTATITQAVQCPMTFEGPLAISAEDWKAGLQVISL